MNTVDVFCQRILFEPVLIDCAFDEGIQPLLYSQATPSLLLWPPDGANVAAVHIHRCAWLCC